MVVNSTVSSAPVFVAFGGGHHREDRCTAQPVRLLQIRWRAERIHQRFLDHVLRDQWKADTFVLARLAFPIPWIPPVHDG